MLDNLHHDASKFISDMLVEVSRLSPLQVLAGIAIGALSVYLMNRTKGSLLVAASAGLYALPLLFM